MSPFLSRLGRVRAEAMEQGEERAARVLRNVWRSRRPESAWQRAAQTGRHGWRARARNVVRLAALRAGRIRPRVKLPGWMGRSAKASRLAWRLRMVAPRMTRARRVWRKRAAHWQEAGAYGGAWRSYYFATARAEAMGGRAPVAPHPSR